MSSWSRPGMTTESFLRAVDEAWGPARAAGVVGGASIEDLFDHAAGFIPAAFRVHSPIECIDVGTGAGLPGLLLAHQLPLSHWTLLDSNERRCDLARMALVASGLESRVDIVHADVGDFGSVGGGRRRFDLVVARLFAGFPETAECCLPLLRVGGSMVVSCSRDALPSWESTPLGRLGGEFVESWVVGEGVYVRVMGVEGLEDRFPRRLASRRRKPFPG